MPRIVSNRPVIFYAFAIVAASCFSSNAFAQVDSAESIARMRKDLEYLASDELEGRDSGSPGIRKAAEFIVARHKALGLETEIFDDSPFQNFQIDGTFAAVDDTNQLSITVGDESYEAELGKSFTALGLGNNAAFEGGLVFAGFGISAEELDYDDFAGIDAKGKVVIVIRKEPQQLDEESKFDGTRSSKHAFFTAKIANLKKQGAVAMIMVNDAVTAASDDGDQLLPAGGAGRTSRLLQIPTIQVTREFLAPVFAAAGKGTLEELEKGIDEDLKPRSFEFEKASVKGETLITRPKIDVRNVVAVMPGKGDLANERIIVGAHYDHVGRGGSGSLAAGSTAIHNGADDNGSGTVSLLEVAHRLSKMDADHRRTIVFMSFTGEEKGLLGSRHYVQNPRWPLEDTVAMLNMDMVGRLTDNNLQIYGTGTAEPFAEMIDRLNEVGKFDLTIHPEGTGPSDHASFYRAGMPVFHFFTGLHSQYHRPSDDVELVNFEGMERIVTMVTSATQEIATAKQRPKFIGARAPARRAVLGVQLDTSSQDQVQISGTTEGGAAEKAGLLAGDVILELNGEKINSFDDLRGILSKMKPGAEVKVKVNRGDEEKEFTFELGAA